MDHLDKGDADEAADVGDVGRDNKLAEKIAAIQGRRERHKALLDELDRTGEDQISLTDPDARAMARMTKVGVGYNVQLAVDTKHKLIAEQEVTNQVLNMGLLAPTVTAAMETCGVETIEAVADRGYFKSRTSTRAKRPASRPTCPSPSEGLRLERASSPKRSFAIRAIGTCISARPMWCCRPAISASPVTT